MQVPSYPNNRPLDIDDKELFDGVFRRLQPRVSELTFAGLYLFRHPHSYRLSMLGDSLVLFGRGYRGGEYFLPPLTGDIHAATSRLLDDGFTLYGADATFVETHLNAAADLHLVQDRDNFDYLYLRTDLADLPGNRYHKKKNRVSYFSARHSWKVERYSPDFLAGSLKLLDEWLRVRSDIESPSLVQEAKVTAEALQEADRLGLEGVVVVVDGVVKGFSLGERLNATTSVCHFEKADPFMEGLSQLADKEFNRLLFTDCIWVNREQDLGEQGLRSAKLSYHPAELIKKYLVTRKKRELFAL